MSVVYLGMSGGVDSALSAALLQEAGHTVRGVYMRNWSRDLPGFNCPWAQDLADAERVAVLLGIPLEVWDYEDEYNQTVVDYLVDAYAKGYTPNPDVMCNQTIKFGTFLERALEEGADYIATGHYARLLASPSASGTPRAVTPHGAATPHSDVPQLHRAADEHKDQTYFLWRVAPELFKHVLFPIGDIPSKDEVRQMCAQRGLGIESKPDSDGICFIGPVGMRTFLLDSLSRKAGPIVDAHTGAVLGQHDGAFLYTLGQRQGLGIGGGPRRYVCHIDAPQNIVYVTDNAQDDLLWTHTMSLDDVHIFDEEALAQKPVMVRTRHTGALAEARVELDASKKTATLTFTERHEAVAPGQSAVMYAGTQLVAGGLVTPRAVELPAVRSDA